ncbi:hypothetical protein F4774DRAFT_379954 [Daldinia eschscholtzii]|nr:hypothetical protein F4774DRAFT_379954 [Daldinia eschscholtzii]
MFSQGWPFASTNRYTEPSQHPRDRRTHRSARRDPSQERRRKIELIDLDDIFTERDPVRIVVKESWQLHQVATSLRRRFPEGAQEIPEDAEVQFFFNFKRLHGDDVPKDTRLLFYRVLRKGDDGSFRVIWRGANIKLRKPERETVAREVAAGKSIGSIRETVANLLRDTNKSKEDLVQNSNQIVVETEGGLKQRSLEGNSWEARKVAAWLCRYIIITIKPADKYFVLQGFNEQYVCHEACINQRGYADTTKLKNWLKNDVLAAVYADNKPRRRHINLEDIRLTYRGRTVTKNNHIRPGAIIDFDVPRSIEEKFIRGESWLVPPTETCMVCSDEKRVSEMPNRKRITAACEHDATTCKECVGLWIASSMERTAWDRLKCPECPQLLKYEDVRAFASREIFDRYDMLATKALLSSIPEFMWCLNPGCESGQIHPAGCSKVRCQGCKRNLCIRHGVPWHKGETCDEYEKRTRRQRKNDEASEKHIKEMSKPCPGCNRNIHKYTGCDHVTCICGHEWCWLCLEPYYKDERDFLQCQHTRECQYHDNPPNYEGGRAFMPFMNAQRAPNARFAPPFQRAGPQRREQGQNILFPIRPRNRIPEDQLVPGPVPVPRVEDDEVPNRVWARRGAVDGNPFDPAAGANPARPPLQPRARPPNRRMDPRVFEFMNDAMRTHLLDMMERR